MVRIHWGALILCWIRDRKSGARNLLLLLLQPACSFRPRFGALEKRVKTSHRRGAKGPLRRKAKRSPTGRERRCTLCPRARVARRRHKRDRGPRDVARCHARPHASPAISGIGGQVRSACTFWGAAGGALRRGFLRAFVRLAFEVGARSRFRPRASLESFTCCGWRCAW